MAFIGSIVFDYLIDPEVNFPTVVIAILMGICNVGLFSIMFGKTDWLIKK